MLCYVAILTPTSNDLPEQVFVNETELGAQRAACLFLGREVEWEPALDQPSLAHGIRLLARTSDRTGTSYLVLIFLRRVGN